MQTNQSHHRWRAAGAFVCLLACVARAGAAESPAAALPRIVTKRGETFALGKKPYPPGTRAQWIAEGRALARAPEGYLRRAKTLKGAADNRAVLPPIRSQGSEGSCVHWAGAYYVKTANMKRRNPALNVAATSNQCSPRFTYNLTNGGEDNGGYGHEPFEIFMRYGGASLLQKPYVAGQYADLPTVADFVEGLHRRTTNYVWVWEWNPTTAEIAELKAFLDDGGVAACGVYAEDSFDAWDKGDPPWVGATCSSSDINHMVTVCGYGPGYYLVANSWGTSFGSNGYIVVAADYFENYFSDVMYPLEGTYEPATSHAQIQIQHGRRSDVRSLSFSVNGTTVWSNSPLPKNAPLGTGSFDTDTRDDWKLAVDLSSAPWAADNVVTARCMDRVTGTAGSLTDFTVRFDGADHVSAQTPRAIPDNTGAAAFAAVSASSGADALTLRPASTNIPAAASSGRQIAVTANVAWLASLGPDSTWLTIAAGAGTGDGTVIFDAASNAGTASRTGRVVVAGGGLARTCTVVQAGTSSGSSPLGEAVEAPSWEWTTGGDADWISQGAVSHDGVDAAQSGDVANDQQTWMQTTVTGPGTIRFWWSVSSESNYDYLQFLIDGAEQSGSISGAVAWQQKTHSIPAGEHVLQWRYSKDVSLSTGSDCGWVDQVVWTPGEPSPGEIGDFDGDGAADAATFQAAGGSWSFLYSGGGSGSAAFGWSSVVPVPADYDGDGGVDLAVYHPASGNWYIHPSGGGSDRVEPFGWSSSIPLPGDYDGDGLADLAVFHRPTARWYFRYSLGLPDAGVAFGWSAVLPVPADYDGDEVVDLAVYHPATGNWYVHESSTEEVVVRQLGGGQALPVPADYDGDGKADVAVFTRATARWQVAYSGGGSWAMAYGWSAVVPVPADYDGDGKADIAIYHPAGGKWYVRQSSDLATVVKTLGGPGKNPILLNFLIHSWFKLL